MGELDVAVQPERLVAVFAFPFATHAAPLLDLVRVISASSPSTTFFFFSTKKSNWANFPDGAQDPLFPNTKPYNVNDGVPEGYVPTGNPLAFVHMFLKEMTRNFRSALVKAEAEMGRTISCLVTDAFYWFGAEIAEERNVPWVPVWTAGPKAILSHVLTDQIRETLGTEGYQDKPLDFIPDFESLRPTDLPLDVFLPDFSVDPFAAMVHQMGRALPRSAALATNYFPSLTTPSSILPSSLAPSKYLPAGPFFLLPTVTGPRVPSTDDHGCLPFLDSHPASSVAYISFGSVITPPPHELEALASALLATNTPFLWSYRGDPRENLLNKFLDEANARGQGKIVPWAPQREVLRHEAVGVFLTHCGWNSMMESMVGGVPMIARPFFGDQQMNARIIEAEWQIGVALECGKGREVKVAEVAEGLRKVLGKEEGKRMRERAKAMGELALKDCEGENGGSIKNFKDLIKIITQQ